MEKELLLVEDEPDLLKLTKIRLEAAGYNVLAAKSAEQALLLLKQTKPDLILLELVLPKMSGEVLCKRLKSNAVYKHIPIIVFTAKVIKVPEEVNAMGADDYIMKPFESKEMLRKIARYLGENT